MVQRRHHTQAVGAAKAGISERSARRIEKDPRLPSQKKRERHWRTRPDPLEQVWSRVEELLKIEGILAVTIFEHVASFRIPCTDLVFYGQKPKQPLSDMTLLKTMHDMATGATVHGLRSSFRDWVAEETNYPGEVAEAALAHTIPNRVEAAYRRTDFLAKRRAMMDDWAAFCGR